jgi:hypothetical protein
VVKSIHTSTLVLWKEESMVIQNVLEKAKLTKQKKTCTSSPLGKNTLKKKCTHNENSCSTSPPPFSSSQLPSHPISSDFLQVKNANKPTSS